MFDKFIQDERRKILDGTYPSRVIDGRQRKHIDGTVEFEQKRASMKRFDPIAEPSKLKSGLDVQRLVDKYKGSGFVYSVSNSEYPREDIIADEVIGETWVSNLGEYVETTVFTISYSKTGVHIFPVNEFGRR